MTWHTSPILQQSFRERKAWQPVAPAERYWHIDVIRGLALFGVLIVNELTMFRVPLLEHILSPKIQNASLDSWVERLVEFGLEFKAVTIFSFLFGVGIAIQIERAEAAKIDVARFLIRRLTWLCLFGVVHMLLIWDGDILVLYAVCGLMLLPVLRLSWPAAVIVGAILLAIPEFVSLPLSLPSGMSASMQIQQAREIYGSGNFLEILRFRWHETRLLILPLLAGILPRTLALILWGTAGWRSSVLRQPSQHRRKLVLAFICGLTAVVVQGSRFPAIVATAYLSGLLLLLPVMGLSRVQSLAATGRMAITNYLLQSIVLGFVFYGYGFSLLGRLKSAQAVGIGLAFYILQVKTSTRWLRSFRFGPVEWAWRSLTYWRRQPMRLVRS